MKKIIVIALLTISSKIMNTQNFESHKWISRLVLVVSSDSNSEVFKKQLKELDSNPDGLKDRKLIVYKILPKNQKTANTDSTWIYNSKLQTAYIKSGELFKVILIGLDGGTKLEQNRILTTEELFSTIDAMPLRKNEVKTYK